MYKRRGTEEIDWQWSTVNQDAERNALLKKKKAKLQGRKR